MAPTQKKQPVLAEQVAKLETDFRYQYDYNFELVKELSQVKADVEAGLRDIASWRDLYFKEKSARRWRNVFFLFLAGWVVSSLTAIWLVYEKFFGLTG